jgi:hypothetical protein
VGLLAGSEGSIGTGASDFECGLRGPVGKVLMNGLLLEPSCRTTGL